MRKLLFFFFAGWLITVVSYAQESKTSTLNQKDSQGKKHGMWFISRPPELGEPGITEVGSYEHGKKYGTWYKMDHIGDLVSIELFRNDVLDGEAKYFERGQLYCTGFYRGLNPARPYDTIVVIDPDTHEASFKVIDTEKGTMRHGLWRYYEPASGQLIREEEYQVDELIYKQEFEQNSKADSLRRKKHQERLPHKKNNYYKPAAGKESLHTGMK